MKDNKDNSLMWTVLFVAALVVVALYLNNEASKTAQRCIENGGQWVQVTIKTFTCVMPK